MCTNKNWEMFLRLLLPPGRSRSTFNPWSFKGTATPTRTDQQSTMCITGLLITSISIYLDFISYFALIQPFINSRQQSRLLQPLQHLIEWQHRSGCHMLSNPKLPNDLSNFMKMLKIMGDKINPWGTPAKAKAKSQRIPVPFSAIYPPGRTGMPAKNDP